MPETNIELIEDRHGGVLGFASDDPELLRQCAASWQMDASQIAQHFPNGYPAASGVSADALRDRIVDLAVKFTDANDRGDAAADALEQAEDDSITDYYTAGLMQAAEAADEDYNHFKAELFIAVRAFNKAIAPATAGGDTTIDRAFAIADTAMFELIESEGVPGDESRTVIGLVDEACQEVTSLAEASSAIQEAFEWLKERGYVELGEDKDGEFINVLRRPGEE